MKKIFLACSKWCYHYIPDIKKTLELMGYEVILPNFYDDPMIEERIKSDMTKEEHIQFCKKSFEMSMEKSKNSDAILVLNYDKVKDGVVYENYIGGATFLEMYDSYLLNHPIFLCNPIPDGMLYDEIEGMNSTIIDGDLLKLKYHLDNSFSKYFSYEDYTKIQNLDDIYFKSIILVRTLFKDKFDKSGNPYIGHLERVSDRMSTIDGKVAGLLHDVVEDIDGLEFSNLRNIGISENIIQALQLVTNEKTEQKYTKEEKLLRYNQKIEHIIESGNDLAIELKLSDMSDNYDEERLAQLPLEKQEWFHKKYGSNIEKLREARKKGIKVYVRH